MEKGMESTIVCYNVCDLNAQHTSTQHTSTQEKLILLKKGTENYTNNTLQTIRLWESNLDVTKSHEILLKIAFSQGTVGKVKNIPIRDTTSINELHNDIAEGYKNAKIPTGNRGSIISGTNIDDYKQMFYRLWANDNYIIHPRTSEFLIGTSLLERKKINVHRKTQHLKRFTAVPYHSRVNATQISGRFIVTQRHEKTVPSDIGKLQYKLDGTLEYKSTKQFKTVWYTRYNRRR
jgi:hypothetical protein